MLRFFKPFPLQRQHDVKDCGAACLSMIFEYHGSKFTLSEVKEKIFIGRDGISMLSLTNASKSMGFTSEGFMVSLEALKESISLPCIIHWDDNHYIVLYKINKDIFYIADPRGGLLKYQETEFLEHWQSENSKLEGLSGIILSVAPSNNLSENEVKNTESKNGVNILIQYCLRFKKSLFLIFFSLLLASLIQLILPFFTQAIVDVGIKKKSISIIYLLVFGQLLLFLGEIIGEVIRRWVLLVLSSKINLTIISEFLSKLMKLPLSYFSNKLVGDFLQRVEDHSRIEKFLSVSTLNVLFSFLNLIIFSSVLIYYSPEIFYVFFLFSIGYIVYVTLFMNKRKTLDLKRFNQLKKNNNYLLQLIIGMFEIKLNNSEEKKTQKWQENQIEIYKINIDGALLQQYQETGGILINQLKNILITFIAATSVIEGNLSLGMMLAIQYIVGQLNQPIVSTLSFLRDLQDAKLSIERINDVKLIPDEEQISDIKHLNNKNGEINIKKLYFQYEGPLSPFVLKDINLEIPIGKTTAIVGSSGSGKTTLLKLILKFHKPSEGDIYIGKENLQSVSSSSWRSRCGIVLQDGFLFSDSIQENINMASWDVSQSKMKQSLDFSNSSEFIESLPRKQLTEIGMDGSGLSQGQKQRLLIARAIYKNPDYFFLDEATSSLDSVNESIIHKNLSQVFTGKTVIIIAHRLSTVKNADQIVVMDKGSIVEIGNHVDLVSKKGYYFTLVKNQLDLGSD